MTDWKPTNCPVGFAEQGVPTPIGTPLFSTVSTMVLLGIRGPNEPWKAGRDGIPGVTEFV